MNKKKMIKKIKKEIKNFTGNDVIDLKFEHIESKRQIQKRKIKETINNYVNKYNEIKILNKSLNYYEILLLEVRLEYLELQEAKRNGKLMFLDPNDKLAQKERIEKDIKEFKQLKEKLENDNLFR